MLATAERSDVCEVKQIIDNKKTDTEYNLFRLQEFTATVDDDYPKIDFLAMKDGGASITLISPELARALELQGKYTHTTRHVFTKSRKSIWQKTEIIIIIISTFENPITRKLDNHMNEFLKY